ncbi:SERTA domain-containing protein 3 [Paramarasmius palmivorus]|uniref:SERTA domain-containing protein 3 n=1 Tax=Paramarasmius palmivorus TaxID=297713 RepID=A0AAW0CA48_9AGAR
MCDLTREQQAAFTRECAMAIGLTKALEDLHQDMSKGSKGKKPAGSKYKGTKPTRKSSCIQVASKTPDLADGNIADNKGTPADNDQGNQGEEPDAIEMNDGVKENTGDERNEPKERVIHCVNNLEQLLAWAKAVVMGYAQLDTPMMETWAQFNIQGCSTVFLKGYAEWLLGPETGRRPELWCVTVYKWIEVEEEWNLRGVSSQGPQIKMLKHKQPHGFLQWFKYGRLRWEALVPSEVCADTLGYEWWHWWSKVVNPRWRPKSEDMVMPGGRGSWEAVRIPGKDGFILVLVALWWWCDLLDHPEQDLLWVSSVKAVYWTLNELLKDARANLRGNEPEADQEEDENELDGDSINEKSGEKRKRNGSSGRDKKQCH